MTDATLRLFGDDRDLQKMFERLNKSANKLQKDFQKTGDLPKLVQGATDLGVRTGRAFEQATRKQDQFRRGTRATAQEMTLLQRVADQATTSFGAMVTRYAAGALTLEAARRSFLEFVQIDDKLRRIGVQAGVSFDQIKPLLPFFRELSAQSGKSLDDLLKSFEVLREEGRLSFDQAKMLLPTVAQGAKAADVSVSDMAVSMAAFLRNTKVGLNDASLVQDMLVKGAHDYQLNLEQLIRGAPKLTEVMQDWGFEGPRGVAHIIAMLASMQKATGNTGESVQRLAMLFERLGSDQKLAQAAGFADSEDMIKHLRQAQEAGKNVIEEYLNLIDKAEKRGYRSELTDARQKATVRTLRTDYHLLVDIIKELLKATGTVAKATEELNKGPKKSVDELSAAWDAGKTSLGEFLHAFGATSTLTFFSRLMSAIVADVERLKNSLDSMEQSGWLRPRGSTFGEQVQQRLDASRAARNQRRLTDIQQRGGVVARRRRGNVAPGAPPSFEERWQGEPGGGAAPAAPGRQGAAQPGPGGGGAINNAYLANQRARFAQEMQDDPQLRLRMAALLDLENPGAGPAVVESAMNRGAMTGRSLASITQGGPRSFYGPARRGMVEPRMRSLAGNPRRLAQLNAQIDRALGGSNTVRMHTDQGSAGDPNFHRGGVGVNINRERFNDWGGFKGVDYSRQWREDQMRRINSTPSAPTPFQGSAIPQLDRMREMQQLLQDMRSQMERPMKMKFERDPGESQFRRTSIRRQLDREVRDARWTSLTDIGAA